MAEIISISLNKVQLEDGSWLIYYDGSDINFPCGTYYIDILIGGEKWYSELFTVKNIQSGVHPELINDKFHLPLRFYDNKLKQDYFKCKNLCDVGLLNPIDSIIPFVIDVSTIGAFDLGLIETKIICHDGSVEYNLSGEFNYTYDLTNGIIIHDGHTLSGQLFCGIYYLQVKIGDNYFYSEHFKVENVTNVLIESLFLYTESETVTGFEPITTEEGLEIIL